jgi:hypothetical protein
MCHQQPKSRYAWQLPSPLRDALGHLFIGYSGYPASRVSCDLTSCLERKFLHIEATYFFPSWFLRYACMQHSSAQSQESRRLGSFSERSWTCILVGLCALHRVCFGLLLVDMMKQEFAAGK